MASAGEVGHSMPKPGKVTNIAAFVPSGHSKVFCKVTVRLPETMKKKEALTDGMI